MASESIDEQVERLFKVARKLDVSVSDEEMRSDIRSMLTDEIRFLPAVSPERARHAVEALLYALAGEPMPWMERLAEEWRAERRRFPRDPETLAFPDCASQLLHRVRKAAGR